jgi:hypothetical protein
VEIVDSSKHYWEINDDSKEKVVDRLPREQVFDEIWWFEGSASQNITIDLKSSVFDAYLELYDQDWHLLAADNDSGPSGNDAQITYTLPSLQIYYLLVKSNVEGEYGKYELAIDGGTTTSSYYYYGAMINNTSGSGDVRVNSTPPGLWIECKRKQLRRVYIYYNGNITLNGVNAAYNGYIGMECTTACGE